MSHAAGNDTNHQQQQQQQPYAHQLDGVGGGGGVAGAGGGGGLSMFPGEELTALTLDEMARVARKLEEFARLHPDRVVEAGGADDGRK